MAEDVVITYETLFELLKREMERTDLQKLEPNFFGDVIDYIKDKKKLLQQPINSANSAFLEDERKKIQRQLDNIYKIIKDIYDRREKKIINLAIDKSRTKSHLIDTTALLREEKVMFESLANMLDNYRNEILLTVLNEKLPFMRSIEKDENKEKDFKSALHLKNTTRLVRFVQSVPKFIGPELEEYGPFKEEDIASLPSEIADVLINKGRVEEIKEDG